MTKERKNSETSVEYMIQKQWKPIVSVAKKKKKKYCKQ